MAKVEESIEAEVGKLKTTFKIFKKQDGPIQGLPLGYFQISSGAPMLINAGAMLSPNQAPALLEVLDYLNEQHKQANLKFTLQQFLETDEHSDIFLLNLSLSQHQKLQTIPHFHVLTAPLFSKKEERGYAQSTNGIYAKIFNTIGLLSYCDWFNEDLKQIPFWLDRLDIYRVEARANDFSHEMGSFVLSDFREQIKSLKQEAAHDLLCESDEKKNSAKLRVWQQRLFDTYMSMQDNLADICSALDKLVSYLDEVQNVHPELQKIKLRAVLLKALLAENMDISALRIMTWAKQILLLSLLDCLHGCTSIINSGSKNDRINLVAAIKMAVIHFYQTSNTAILADLFLNWDDVIERTNQQLCDNGLQQFEEWLKTNNKSDFHHKSFIAHQLRLCVFKHLQLFSYPFIKHTTIFPDSQVSNMAMSLSKCFLDAIPETFLEFNLEERKPIGLSPHGIKMLSPLIIHSLLEYLANSGYV